MIKKLAENHKQFIKYSRIYFIICVIFFMIFGTEELEGITERVVLVVAIAIGYLMFFNFTGFYLRLVKSKNKHNWEKAKKVANLQMNFFLIFFGVFGTVMIVLAGLANLEEITFILMASNIPLGIIAGTLKTKSLYIYEIDSQLN